uniref:Chromosome 10 open reading frame 62 n=1 Tax=Microcebus murinus TaxID=30608 RepID=A0A8C5UVR2_MICMU
MLWVQRKRRKAILQTAKNKGESPECHKAENENWIKSHFSRLSEEKLVPNGASTSHNPPQPESGGGEASTTVHMETVTTRQGEVGTALRRESFTSKQKVPGSTVIKETHKESGKSSSSDEATWAAVAACTKEIDTKGRQLANSMLQRATACKKSGHLQSRDINQEELKALEEVEMKLKGSFLNKRENTIAGANHIHTFYGHGHHGQPSHQGHPGQPSHQGHPGHLPNRSH